jgi:alkylated DNA nucleotide flippase Atl1
MAKKSFNEKLIDCKDLPRIVEISDPEGIERWGRKLLIAPPIEYDEIMRRVPEGKVITTDRIRQYLASKHGADSTCPLTAGIFINIAAHASDERGFDETPYWRTLKKDGELNEKYPGGIDKQAERLASEGVKVIKKGKRVFVENYADILFIL